MVGAVSGAALAARGTPVAVAVAVALLLGAASSAALERGVVARVPTRPLLGAAGLVAAGTLLRQGMTVLFPRSAYPFPAPSRVWRVGDGVLRASDLLAIAVV